MGASTSSAGAPTVDDENNGYTWTVDCPGGDTTIETATLTFDSWVGLTLGTFTTHAIATANAVSISTTGAPVTVHQNPEAQDPSTATEIQPDKLVAGHIAFGGEQAFYKVKLDGLTPGTRISAFLNVPSDADLDLTMSAPATPSLFSSPVGSTPVGSTPIEDQAVGFSTAGQALSPDTLQDVPVGSTPVGSTPVGSTPVGSTSDNRGAGVNEAGAIITTGPDRLRHDRRQRLQRRVEQPAVRAARPGDAAADRCPAARPTVAQGRRRLPRRERSRDGRCEHEDALHRQQAAADGAVRERGGHDAPRLAEYARRALRGVRHRSAVDGNAAVRSAYTAWDASPCSTSARNNVVQAINSVVAGYRANNALPNLHYVVLVGSDEATPMADAPDPVLLSPGGGRGIGPRVHDQRRNAWGTRSTPRRRRTRS